MTETVLEPGKLPAALLRRLLARFKKDTPELLLPPSVGEDAGVIGIGGGALVTATDPITMTGNEVGGHAVLINANDVAVLGVRPRWFLAVFLLPVGTTVSEVEGIFENMRQTLEALDIVLVGGHTEVTDAVNQPVVTGQMLGFQTNGHFVKTGGVRPGDKILQIGPAPVEGAAVVALELGTQLSLPDSLLAEARDAILNPGIAVIEPALRSAALGASAMHDPTEGGLSAGLHELAEASSVALEVRASATLWYGPGIALCEAVGADPWGMLASGTLLAAFPSDRVDEAANVLVRDGNDVALLAIAEAGEGVRFDDGRSLPRYERDELSRILAGA